ncbi:hypothetical protein [Enterococcus sp. 5B7_DIV0075]|uniref:hypothetical protein n=1 Tax=unclassified Enterococcus TaxID=2608891 RepID=UPI000B6C102A|nr:hypothetical protein [Enterococcus sp. 5B7_DIV0075]OTP23884.1 hypothetical protein A5800_001742 [Enterococcus sp. 5B7_DIV0075]
MKENKTPASQLEASRKYRERINTDEEKKAHRNYMTSRRAARSFVNTKATLEDLAELEQLIAERKKQLES